MRALLSAALAAAAMTAVAGDVSANPFQAHMGLVMLYSTSDASGSSTTAPRDVAPGEMVMITGECVGHRDDEVHVVLALADPEPRAGWHTMLVTDMEIADGNLRVRVPNMPQARNHTFNVRLYVGDSDPCVCEAGSIRIG